MTCNNKCIHYPVCEQKNYDFANIEECPYYYNAPTVELERVKNELNNELNELKPERPQGGTENEQ